MATYRGGEIPVPDQSEDNLRLRGGRVPGLENVEEELNLPPEVGTERTRRPGEKGYMKEQHMARTPTPKTRGNLPRMDESKSDEYGRELPAPPMKFYERGQATGQGTTTYKHGPFNPPPTPPPGGRGMTQDEITKFREGDEALGYQHGGVVEQPGCKFGSSTIVQCSSKHR